MKILATDLDRTLLPNGKWENDKNAIPLFNKLSKSNNLILIYVTGRSLKLTQNAITEFKIRNPDVLIGDVGTTIRFYKNNYWRKDSQWNKHVYNLCPKWNIKEIQKKLSNIKGLKEQEKSKLNAFKQSYYVDIKLKNSILKEVSTLIKNKYDEEIIYSSDPLKEIGLLDILPKAATKETALKYIMEKYKLTYNEVLYCGDSGNDILPLTCGVNAVLVKNADSQTKSSVKKIMEKNKISNNIYFAKGNFKNLSGYYTSGVIEGAYHFDFFK